MVAKMLEAKTLGETFAHLTDNTAITPLAVSPQFWSKEIAALPDGFLISTLEHRSDWPTWEMHPLGEEWIYCLSGQLTLVMDTGSAAHDVALKEGQFVIVPRGVWHTANVGTPGAAIYITSGRDTQHRKR